MIVNLICFITGIMVTCSTVLPVVKYRCKHCKKVCDAKTCSVKSLSDINLSGDFNKPDRILREKLRVAFEENRIYQNPDLTLEKLSAECGTNRTYLSEFFNRRLNMSFTDFVNNYRIDAVAVKLMKEHPYMSVGDIAIKSGFGSVATFRRAFIRRKGVTPRQFKAALLRQKNDMSKANSEVMKGDRSAF